MSYAGDSQVERVAAGSRSFTTSALGLSLAADGSGTTGYIRDNQGKLTEQRTPSGNYYYLFDGLGSVVALTDSSGAVVNTYSYDPYGNIKSSTGTVANPWRFGGSYGAYHDTDTGLYKIGHRYYESSLGRWTQQDPATVGSTMLLGNSLASNMSVGCAGNPMSWNRYAYADLNPINSTDTLGLWTYCEWGIGIPCGAVATGTCGVVCAGLGFFGCAYICGALWYMPCNKVVDWVCGYCVSKLWGWPVHSHGSTIGRCQVPDDNPRRRSELRAGTRQPRVTEGIAGSYWEDGLSDSGRSDWVPQPSPILSSCQYYTMPSACANPSTKA
jgi:RHS repeat-associated protein